jgi:hypothetical protein
MGAAPLRLPQQILEIGNAQGIAVEIAVDGTHRCDLSG